MGLQRLTTRQTLLTLSELTGIVTPPPASFPREEGGGYLTVPVSQLMSGEWIEQQLEWSLAAAREVVRQKAPRVIDCNVAASSTCASRIIDRLLPRAFRRPVLETETQAFVTLYGTAPGQPADKLTTVLAAIFSSPQFLYRGGEASSTDAVRIVGAYELANRLSYFLWDSMPDEALFAKAADGSLTSAEILEAEVLRMLADPRSESLARAMTDQWFGLGRLENHTLSASAFPDFNDAMRSAMHAETVTFIQHLLSQGTPLKDLVTAPYTFVNATLAPLYGISGSFSTPLVRVELKGTPRRGILGHAGVLALTSSGEKTSIVKRGLWVNEKLLCTHIPSPPAGVDTSLPTDLPPDANPRQIVEAHRSKPLCLGCHRSIDPAGLVLEQLDPLGRERSAYPLTPEQPIDTRTELADGTRVANLGEFTERLASSPQFSQCVTESLLPLAVGRFAKNADRCAIEAVAGNSGKSEQTLTGLLQALVTSRLFRIKGLEERP